VTYAAWYLGIGFIVLTVLYINHKIRRTYEPTSFHDILEATDPDRDKVSYKLLNYVAAPLLGLCIWPLAIFMIVQDYFQVSNTSLDDDPTLFSVKAQHLTERLAITEIERRETYLDPMLAVPALPFGHLNQSWRDFIASQSTDDELWAFTADWETTWGGKEMRRGYVFVRDGKPGAYYLSSRKILSDEDS
jgi:hypothetical protein